MSDENKKEVEKKEGQKGSQKDKGEPKSEKAAAAKAAAQASGKGKRGAKEAAPPAEPVKFVKRTAPARLRRKYHEEVIPALMQEFGYKNRMAAPKLVKITVNFGLGEALQNPKLVDSAEAQLAAISGQKPVITKAKKSIATFKLRQGQAIGCMVTLRKDHMYEFLDRLVSIALPRTRDFRGVSQKCFDGRGNMTLGIKEQIIFPEIDYDKIEKVKGLNVCLVTTAKNDEEGRALLRHLGMPFRG